MERMHVGQFAGRHDGATMTIVGKGRTMFDYANLSQVDGPVIFLNDAVQFEHHVPERFASYFFCHHEHQAAHLGPALRSTAVLPASGARGSTGRPLIGADECEAADGVPRLATYQWADYFRGAPESVGTLSRRAVAESGELFIAQGVIHTAIHFAWLCGAERVRFIGCDGHTAPGTHAYDQRISTSESGSKPGTCFGKIRRTQDWLCDQLGLETEYVRESDLRERIPRRAHFVWLGSDLPGWAQDNIDRFRSAHPGWRVDVWRDVPGNTPPEVRRILEGCEQYCQMSDIISYWLLFRHGGVYLDCDVMTLRPIDRLLRFYSWACRQLNQVGDQWNVNCAIMGAAKHAEPFRRVLERAEQLNAKHGRPRRRAAYGPDLLSEMFDAPEVKPWGTRGGFSVVPSHWWQIFRCAPRGKPHEGREFLQADESRRREMLSTLRVRWMDDTEPYGVHLFGPDGSGHKAIEKKAVHA